MLIYAYPIALQKEEMFLQLLVLLFIANAASNFEGGEGRKLSGKEELDIESQLKILNKPAVISFHVSNFSSPFLLLLINFLELLYNVKLTIDQLS